LGDVVRRFLHGWAWWHESPGPALTAATEIFGPPWPILGQQMKADLGNRESWTPPPQSPLASTAKWLLLSPLS
jgi:hypothetical protein